jgi:hypothetical protein
MMELREEIRRILLESLLSLNEWVMPQNTFPYETDGVVEPQQIDPLTHYVLDWEKLSTNNSVFEFPKDEFELGMKIERNKDGKSQLLDIAAKVIEQLKSDPQFYSNLTSRAGI